MSATANFLYTPFPAISKMETVGDLTIRVTWSDGIRSGRTDLIDLSPMINSLKHYRPLRNDPDLFATAHMTYGGRVLAWGPTDEIDMAADSIESLAEETMTANDLREFLYEYDLTHSEAAALLGRSRRQIENYLSGSEAIPRTFVLACFGLVARRMLRGPVTKVRSNTTKVQAIDENSSVLTGSIAEPIISHRGTSQAA